MSPGVAPVAGVEIASASEPLSAEDGRAAVTSVDEAGEERSFALSTLSLVVARVGLRSAASVVNRRSTSDDSLRVTTRELVAFLEALARLARPLVVEPAPGIVEEMVIWSLVWSWSRAIV